LVRFTAAVVVATMMVGVDSSLVLSTLTLMPVA
jgi:hypothetical protein